MIPPGHAGDFAQAMMDLGATICHPKVPDCPACPLRRDCAAFASGAPEAYPAAKAKRVRPVRHGIAHWIERDGAVWLVRRPPKGMLGGMAALPGGAWTDQLQPLPAPPLARVRHVFTHFALELAVLEVDRPMERAGGTRSTVSMTLACRPFTAVPPSVPSPDPGSAFPPCLARLKKPQLLPKGQATP